MLSVVVTLTAGDLAGSGYFDGWGFSICLATHMVNNSCYGYYYHMLFDLCYMFD